MSDEIPESTPARPRPRPSPRPVDADAAAAPVEQAALPASEDGAAEPSTIEKPERSPASATVRSLPLAWFPAAVLAVAALLLVVLLGIFSFRGYWAKPGADGPKAPSTRQQEQVLAAAKTCFATLNSYDYRKLDDALSAGEKCTTGKFTSDYRNVFTTQVKKYAPGLKMVRNTQVNKAGIVSISSDGKQWVVLIYGQLSLASTQTSSSGTPRIDPLDGVVTMDQVGNAWLVAKIDNDAGNGLSS